ncbi:O-antigen ligase domain-containing protein [Candidatus Falkowbacteria bacterium]|jgi:O-antigen ligase|nr:O-antigen ligase family protein [Patescibacteria group bacterium]MDD3435226.1 O-antigen ligase family protein [Patescibacteria group bacterium]MDD4466582.1 O-antigen ligase family protein [Patescibacteria group bacterium]NCU43281.1 O-antigen ligase domain-containing protein [Candidatus Falkowbacteria bacterium]
MKLIGKSTWLTFIGLALVSGLSVVNYFFPAYSLIILVFIGLLVFALAFYRLEYGVLIAIAELIIGSKGRLFDQGLVSLRMVIFTAVLAACLLKIIKERSLGPLSDFVTKNWIWPWFLALLVFLGLGFLSGLIRSYPLEIIFADANSWLFLGLLIPLIIVYYQAPLSTFERLIQVLSGALLWLIGETFFILFAFTHSLPFISDLYWWLRKTGLAEVTATAGSWSRIFFQSHLYPALAVVILPFVKIKQRSALIVLNSFSWGVLILSMSRSFWLAVAFALGSGILMLLIWRRWRFLIQVLLKVLVPAILGFVLIFATAAFPFPDPGKISTEAFSNRLEIDSEEPAVASRWSLLGPLWGAIKEHWFLGSGFGREIVYETSDPRFLDMQETSTYRTYAFEWGYFGIWLKIGILGLLSYLIILAYLFIKNLQRWRAGDNLAGSLALALLALLVIHFFTPYLDHPLGFLVWFLIWIISQNQARLLNNLPEITK